MTITIQPISEALGAEISGLDLRQPLDAASVKDLHEAWLDYGVLFVRNQDLSDGEHAAFCQYFGTIQVERTAPEVESAQHAGMLFVSNFREDAILPDGEMWFHSDQCYFDLPVSATSLYAIEVPSQGGHTKFCNCYRPYEDLPDDVKKTLEGKKALNVYD